MSLDLYLGDIRRRAKQLGYLRDEPPGMFRMSVDSYAHELMQQSANGYRLMFPEVLNEEDPYEGAYTEPCPQLTDFACYAVSWVEHIMGHIQFEAEGLLYILFGRETTGMRYAVEDDPMSRHYGFND